MLLKIFVVCFLFSVSAIALLLFLTSEFSTTGTGINNSDRKTAVKKSTRHLQVPPQQLVDLRSFQFTINNDICGQKAITIVTLVSSAVPNKAARAAVRSTWASPDLHGGALVFLLGTPVAGARAQKLLEDESQEFGDIVQGNFLDTYRNLTYKNLMGKLWVASFCSQAELIVKTDDDAYVDLYAAKAITEHLIDFEELRLGSWILGPVKKQAPVLRASSKWAVTADEVNPARKYYPHYCNSIFYIFNVATATKIVEAAKAAKYFFIDDVFVTGFLREKLNITLVDSKDYQTLDAHQLLRTKAVQSPHTFVKDKINGLLNRGPDHLKICTQLEAYARWCYKNR